MLEMTPEEYESYKKMRGIEEYSIASTATGVDVEAEDAKADENEEWYDAEVNPHELQQLKEEQEMEIVLQEVELVESKKKQGEKSVGPTTREEEEIETKDLPKLNSIQKDHNKGEIKHSTQSAQPSTEPSDNEEITNTSTTYLKESNPYKSINHTSTNRRNKSDLRDKTPDRNNKTRYQYQYYTRVTFKMHVKSSNSPLLTIRETLREFLRELSQIDSAASILPERRNPPWNQ